MAQIFAGNGQDFPAFLPVNRGFGRFHVVAGAGLDLDETQYVLMPPNQVDFAATVGRTKIASDHGVSLSSKIEVGVFFATPASAQVLWAFAGWQGLGCYPVKDTNRGVGETAGEHSADAKGRSEILAVTDVTRLAVWNLPPKPLRKVRKSIPRSTQRIPLSGNRWPAQEISVLRGRATNRGTSVQSVYR